MTPMPWWALAALIAVTAVLLAALCWWDRWLDRRLAGRVTADQAVAHTREAWERAAWESLVERLNDGSGR